MNTAHAPLSGTERKLDRLLAHYGESHRNPRNELIHFVAIPAILLSIVGLLYALHPWVAYAFTAASLVYYAMLRSTVLWVTMALGTVVVLAAVRGLGESVLPVCAAVFVVAWIFQFIGHKIEGRKPSFFEDIQYLWVGPLFVVTRIYDRLGVRW
ncbi:DUF962 domain-containing protein [Variovorax rhizosphaerae]|uniref:Mpo1-like protein n=1 Tax=Variovorax rhizosphaerae TaxID=1836200 RepID=A0ABU8WNC9_9BURK